MRPYLLSVLSVFLLFIATSSMAQFSVRGKVTGTDSSLIAGATVILYQVKDSAVVQVATTDTLGEFLLKAHTAGTYFLQIGCVGHETRSWPSFSVVRSGDHINVGSLVLATRTIQLDQYTVTAREKGTEQKDGMLVVNLKNSPVAAGSSVLELLERLPTVTVNQQNNTLSIKGKSDALVMINGRRNYMPVDALFQWLAGMNAVNVEKVEIITNPSASLDAEGNAGFINIVLKKNKNEGLSGNVSAGLGYGAGSLENVNGDVAYTSGKLGVFGSYSFSRNCQRQLSFNSREEEGNSQAFSVSTNSERTPVQRNHNIQVGADYQPGKDTYIGIMLTGYNNKWDMNALNTSTISVLRADTLLQISNHEINQWDHYGANGNFQHSFRNKSVLSASVDYLSYKNSNPVSYTENYYDDEKNFLFGQLSRSSKSTPIGIFVAKADYTIFSGKAWKMQAGAKSSVSNLTNDVAVSSMSQRQWVIDSSLTSDSKLKEVIFAGYGEVNYNIKDKTTIKGGLRYEYTDFDLNLDGDSRMRYGNWFPSLIFNTKLGQHSSIGFSYVKRINRPSFTDIAPFFLFIDPYTLFSGNPAVQPSTSNSFTIDYTIGPLSISSSFTSEKNALTKFQISVDTGSNIELIKPENLGTIRSFNSTIILPVRICRFWSSQNTMSGLWQEVDAGVFEHNEMLDKWSLQISSTQSVKLPANYSLEVTGFYNSAMLSGTSQLQAVGGLNFGAQKVFGRSTIRLNYNDILNTLKYTSLVQANGYDIRNGFSFSHPTLKIGYTYKFGSSHPAEKPVRRPDLPEEKARVE